MSLVKKIWISILFLATSSALHAGLVLDDFDSGSASSFRQSGGHGHVHGNQYDYDAVAGPVGGYRQTFSWAGHWLGGHRYHSASVDAGSSALVFSGGNGSNGSAAIQYGSLAGAVNPNPGINDSSFTPGGSPLGLDLSSHVSLALNYLSTDAVTVFATIQTTAGNYSSNHIAVAADAGPGKVVFSAADFTVAPVDMNQVQGFSFGFQAPGSGGTMVIDSITAAVPEPSTYALMGLGVLGVLALRRRRK